MILHEVTRENKRGSFLRHVV